MPNCVILASGTGTNARALAAHPRVLPRIKAILSDRRNSNVLSWAAASGFEAVHIDCRNVERRTADERVRSAIWDTGADLVVLAGFMRILGAPVVDTFDSRIVNIHPALLPRHPGLHAMQRSWEAGDAYLGVSVHVVDTGVDTGPLLAQAGVARESISSRSQLETLIHSIEHAMYPEIVAQLLDMIEKNRECDIRTPEQLDTSRIQAALPQAATLFYPK